MDGLLRLKFSKGCKLLESYDSLLILKQSEFWKKMHAVPIFWLILYVSKSHESLSARSSTSLFKVKSNFTLPLDHAFNEILAKSRGHNLYRLD